MMKHMALKRTLGRRGHEGHSLGTTLPQTETQSPGGLKLFILKTPALFSPKEGGEGMNNIIKRRQD